MKSLLPIRFNIKHMRGTAAFPKGPISIPAFLFSHINIITQGIPSPFLSGKFLSFLNNSIDSTNDQNTMLKSYLMLHLYIHDQTMHQRKNLKLPYLRRYTRNICEIWRIET